MYHNLVLLDAEYNARLLEIGKNAIGPLLLGAVQYTIPLALITFAIGLVIAVFTALARISNNIALNLLARVYVSIVRGTPLLVQLFIIFYGLPTIGVMLEPLPAAIIGLSLNVGAYASEVVRSAIISIPKGQWEAAYSMGMIRSQALRRIILPQATRVSIPPLSNTFISLVKDTSLASLVLVAELFRKAQEIASHNYEFLFIYSLAALIYWVICFILSLIQGRLEARLERHVGKSGGHS